ncbi:MAG: deoxyhypusine synthase family protein, partial [Candidatus Kariarchaeaceae archaeon]
SQVILTPSELVDYLGSLISDNESIVRTAHELKIPIFVPALSDSVLGLQIWLFSQFNPLIIDATKDLGKIQDKYHEREKNCAFILGGGVPKNYTLQAALMASRQYNYAVQVTMDRVETGGLSGADLEETKSWGKLEPDAETVTIISDLTIALPIIIRSLLARQNGE